jgi:7-keto-8-aminopelargonate synthetase-like enzyme
MIGRFFPCVIWPPPYNPGMTEPDSLQFIGRNQVRLRRRILSYFSGCDYFRLARDPRVAQAARAALRRHGLNVAASRRTTGNHPIYGALEAALADFFDAEAALLLPDGYFAPLAAAQALAGEFTQVLVDELAHGALQDAAPMLAGPVTPFKHRDAGALARLVAKCGRPARPIVLTDGMFSHDGSVAPLRAYLKILPPRGLLLVDDAHGVGVLGATGQGSLEQEGVSRERIVQCATLSKAFGAYGGVVLASHAVRERILERSRVFAGTTPLPPPLAGAALTALKILRREDSRRKRLQQNTQHVRARLRAAGWDIPETSGPIVRLPPMEETQAGALRACLLAAGIYPPFLKYGNSSASGYFRFVISSEHTRAQLDQLTGLLAAFKSAYTQ